MKVYWIIPSNPPEVLVDAWHTLQDSYGTEHFTLHQATEILSKDFTNLMTPGNLARTQERILNLLENYEHQGALASTEETNG